ncbi:MAG: hypothetical protein ACYC3I_06340 [Gemmataceae bacterium]
MSRTSQDIQSVMHWVETLKTEMDFSFESEAPSRASLDALRHRIYDGLTSISNELCDAFPAEYDDAIGLPLIDEQGNA